MFRTQKGSFRSELNAGLLSQVLLIVTIFMIIPPAIARDANTTGLPVAEHETEGGSYRESAPIQDNSFLVEEAYNQEFGVVQHISTFTRSWYTHQWLYTFTQEWPSPSQTHQLSYTISYLNGTSNLGSVGLGDVALNYRYQLLGSGDTRVALAPRFTLLLPSGNYRMGRGFGGAGLQFNLPVSWALGKHWVTHWNAGATLIPSAKDYLGHRAQATGYNLGQSVIWLSSHRLNAMLETVWTSSESVVADHRTVRSQDLLVSPGIRWAYNFRNGLQIVPGIGVPLGVGPSTGEKGLFLYLSFEHPFRNLHSST